MPVSAPNRRPEIKDNKDKRPGRGFFPADYTDLRRLFFVFPDMECGGDDTAFLREREIATFPGTRPCCVMTPDKGWPGLFRHEPDSEDKAVSSPPHLHI